MKRQVRINGIAANPRQPRVRMNYGGFSYKIRGQWSTKKRIGGRSNGNVDARVPAVRVIAEYRWFHREIERERIKMTEGQHRPCFSRRYHKNKRFSTLSGLIFCELDL